MIEQLSYTRTQGKTLDTSNVLGALERVTRRLSGGLHPSSSLGSRSWLGSSLGPTLFTEKHNPGPKTHKHRQSRSKRDTTQLQP